MGAAGADNTSSIVFGGNLAATYYTLTETWNGTSWTEVADLNTARNSTGGAGTNPAALAAGGFLNTGGSPEFFAGTEVLEWISLD
jgi:hypothetical protein